MASKDLLRAISKKTRNQEWGSKTREAETKSNEVQFQRALTHMRDLVVGKITVSVKENKSRKLNGGETAEKVLKLLKRGVTPEAILLHVPTLPERFAWAELDTKEMLYAAAKEDEVDLNQISRVFGLEEPGTVVVAAE